MRDFAKRSQRTPRPRYPLAAGWSGAGARTTVCHRADEAAALDDHDNKTQPQVEQRVEYDHRVATRTIENIRHAHAQGKNFFVAEGLRRPHLAWQVRKRKKK